MGGGNCAYRHVEKSNGEMSRHLTAMFLLEKFFTQFVDKLKLAIYPSSSSNLMDPRL